MMIGFSPPDITQAEIDEVVDTLKSGWITTGPKVHALEDDLVDFTGAAGCSCVGSATAALECALRLLGIGPGDEVITSAYTYTATAASIIHVGAKPVLVDTAKDSYEMDYTALSDLVTERTKAVMPVDIAGRMVDYDALRTALAQAESRWNPTTDLQKACGHIPLVADGAHSLGAVRHGLKSGQAADLTAFSFHAVKNLTTAEGGALVWREGLEESLKESLEEASGKGLKESLEEASREASREALGKSLKEDLKKGQDLHRQVSLMALHGQSKDALAKDKAGAWEYDILFPGWKCNMTDIMAAIGLAQLKRYPSLLDRRHYLAQKYQEGLRDAYTDVLIHAQGDPASDGFVSSAHLMLVRLIGHSRAFRDELIVRLAHAGIPTNVHYKPLPLLTAYRERGFEISQFPYAMAQFENEISLPLHTLLSDDDVDHIISAFTECKQAMEQEGLV